MRIKTAVGSNNAITIEVIIACRITAVVATIGKNLLSRDWTLVTKTLVYKVPNVATLIFRILAYEVPILLERTLRVAHGVSILTLDVRFHGVAFTVSFTLLIIHVHGTMDVGLAVVSATFILHGAGLVNSLYPVVSLLKVNAVARLVAKAPHDD